MRCAEPVGSRATRPAGAPSTTSGSPPAATPPLLSLQRLVGNRTVTALLAQREPAVAPPAPSALAPAKGDTMAARPKLAPAQDARFERFRLAALGSGVGLDGARRLWALGGGGGEDALTGLARTSDAAEMQAIAARHGASYDSPSFVVTARVRNLGGLNNKLGHSGSDEIYGQMAEIVERQLADLGGDVEGFRKGGPEFGFIVVPKVPRARAEDARAALRARLNDAHALVKGLVANSGLSEVAHPRRPGDETAKGSGVDLDVSDLVVANGANGPTDAPLPPTAAQVPASPEPGEAGGFLGAAEERERAFLAAAGDLGVDAKKATELYGLASGSEKDVLTGFSPASDRMATIAKAAGFAGAQQVAALYVEVDISNLGGLNEAIGEAEASKVMARIAAITHAELSGLPATVCPFRHGGDEISFVVVARPGGPGGDLDAAVRSRLGAARSKVRQEFARYASVAHPKHRDQPDRAGTGIAFGTAAITAGADANAVVKVADQEVERVKG